MIQDEEPKSRKTKTIQSSVSLHNGAHSADKAANQDIQEQKRSGFYNASPELFDKEIIRVNS